MIRSVVAGDSAVNNSEAEKEVAKWKTSSAMANKISDQLTKAYKLKLFEVESRPDLGDAPIYNVNCHLSKEQLIYENIIKQ
jgi:hypothetical protein